MDDPYLYPGTKILRNRLDIRNADDLAEFERRASSVRLESLLWDIPLTPAGYRSIHRRMFQDVYEWAGQDRSIDIARTSWFARPHLIDGSLTTCFAALNAQNNLRGLDVPTFAYRAAEHCGDLNTIPPFREGNGRTLRAFLERLGLQAGHVVDLVCIKPAF